MRRSALLPAAILIAVLLASCATETTSGTPVQSPVSHATATPTDSPPTPTEMAVRGQCGVAGPESVHDGDLAFTLPEVLYAFNANFALPENLPSAPLAISIPNNARVVGGVPIESRPAVGPISFVIGICNTSKTVGHRLTGFGATLATKSAYSGSLNVLNACAFLYGRPTGAGGECSSGFEPDIEAMPSLAANAMVGASATWTPNFSIELAPGMGTTATFTMPAPTGLAMVTYRLGVATDGGSVHYVLPATQQEVFAPIVRTWDGRACASATMQAQIPASIPQDTYYACPPA